MLFIAVDCRDIRVVFVPDALGLEVVAQIIVFVADLIDLGCRPFERHGFSLDGPFCVVDDL